jgi:hypothetical protein
MIRSPNLYGDPQTVIRYLSRPCHCPHLHWHLHSVYGYDAERDADLTIAAYLDKQEPIDKQTGVTVRELEKFVGWWWPRKESPPTRLEISPLKIVDV